MIIVQSILVTGCRNGFIPLWRSVFFLSRKVRCTIILNKNLLLHVNHMFDLKQAKWNHYYAAQVTMVMVMM